MVLNRLNGAGWGGRLRPVNVDYKPHYGRVFNTCIGYGVMVNIGDSHLEYSPARGSIPRIRDTQSQPFMSLFVDFFEATHGLNTKR